MALSSMSKTITSDGFTTVLINFSDLPGNGGTLVSNNVFFGSEYQLMLRVKRAIRTGIGSISRLVTMAPRLVSTIILLKTNVLIVKLAVSYRQHGLCPRHRYRTRIFEC
jgi:hypothetical protein